MKIDKNKQVLIGLLAVVALIGAPKVFGGSASPGSAAYKKCEAEQERRKANFGGRHTYGGGPGQINDFICKEVQKICDTESADKCTQALNFSLM